MKQAQEVQQIILPETRMELPGLIVESEYRPAQVVGGEFFQVIPLAGQGTLVVAGDVSGKGMRAAMMVSLIVGVIRTLAEQNPSPAAMLAGINRRLIGRTHGGFATCCAVLIRTDGMATFANAGHLQPYLNGEEIELPAGLPAGIVDGMSYEEVSLQIPPHAKLVLLSDGVVEARNEKGEIFGFDRTAAMANNSAAAIAHAAQAFGQDDDITVLTLTRLAST
jgi:phosphoserine phosphatase RsbU/P